MENKNQPQLYFINGPIDFTLVGGFSVILCAILFLLKGKVSQESVVALAGSLTFVCNHPHFASTNYRMYHSKSNILQFPITAIIVPIVILFGVLASFQFPLTVAPYFVKLFILWSPYHFSGQSVGVSLIYARRAGFRVGKWERLALSTFIFSAFVSTLLTYDTSLDPIEYYGMTYPSFGLPFWTVSVAKTVMYLAGLSYLFFVLRWSRTEKKRIPIILLVVPITHFVWFQLGNSIPTFQEFVPFFHSLQYLLIAWAVQMRESLDVSGATPSKKFVLSQSAKWMVLNIAGGYAMFELLPYVFDMQQRNFNFATGIVAAGVQMHHFFVDGVIWKLKNKTNASPLLSNIRDFIGPKQPVVQSIPELVVVPS